MYVGRVIDFAAPGAIRNWRQRCGLRFQQPLRDGREILVSGVRRGIGHNFREECFHMLAVEGPGRNGGLQCPDRVRNGVVRQAEFAKLCGIYGMTLF